MHSAMGAPYSAHPSTTMVLPIWLLIIIALLTIAILKIVHSIWSIYRISKCLEHIPVALDKPVHWLFGSFNHMSKPEYYIEKAIWGSDNGVRLSKEWWGLLYPTIIVHHPDVWKEVINRPKSTQMYVTMLGPWLGEGLLISEGKRWARNRKLLTAAFHFETIKPYIEIFSECCDVLVEKWRDCVISGRDIPVYADLSRMTLDTLLKCSFSYSSNCQLEDAPYMNAIREVSVLFMERNFSAIYRSAPNWLYLNFIPHGRRFRKITDYIHAYGDDVIAQRRASLAKLMTDSTVPSKEVMAQALKKGNRRCLDFLDILLMARDDEGRGLADLEIRCEVDTFMFEGHDTTAHGLAWALYCLVEYPEHQEKCREEIIQVFGEKNHLDHDDLSRLTYTQWCIKESMRMFPIVFQFTRESREDIMVDGHLIPKGTQIGVGVTNLHRNKEFWPDPEVFDPLRFHSDRISKQHPYAYLPFSAGPRNCIGQNFAMNEMRVVIASILRKFKLSLIEGKKLEVLPALLYGFKNDYLPFKVELLN